MRTNERHRRPLLPEEEQRHPKARYTATEHFSTTSGARPAREEIKGRDHPRRKETAAEAEDPRRQLRKCSEGVLERFFEEIQVS